MGPQPPSLPHTGASRRARRSPSANKTKGVWCRLPPQLLSRSSYAWFWPSFHWILRTHSATLCPLLRRRTAVCLNSLVNFLRDFIVSFSPFDDFQGLTGCL